MLNRVQDRCLRKSYLKGAIPIANRFTTSGECLKVKSSQNRRRTNKAVFRSAVEKSTPTCTRGICKWWSREGKPCAIEPARSRTWNLLIRSQARCPLRHKPVLSCVGHGFARACCQGRFGQKPQQCTLFEWEPWEVCSYLVYILIDTSWLIRSRIYLFRALRSK